jgi:hypothetical protein
LKVLLASSPFGFFQSKARRSPLSSALTYCPLFATFYISVQRAIGFPELSVSSISIPADSQLISYTVTWEDLGKALLHPLSLFLTVCYHRPVTQVVTSLKHTYQE